MIDKINSLKDLQSRITQLQSSIAAERDDELRSLPGRYGYSSLQEFIKALRTNSGAKKIGRPKSGPGKTRKRRRISEQTKTDVRKAIEEGKTGVEIAKAFKISLPSVHNIKKAFGLLNARKK